MTQQHPKAQAQDQPPPPFPPIIIIGAGPVGMTLTYALSRLNIPTLLLDQNTFTTQYPKMDLTNSRSMELLRRLGLSDLYRAQTGAVARDVPFDSLFVTSLGPGGRVLGKWEVGSAEDQDAEIREGNDGSWPVEGGLRCSQIVFEGWMRGVVLGGWGGGDGDGDGDGGKVSFQGGWRYLGHAELEGGKGVVVRVRDLEGRERDIVGRFLVGCDGGRSAVRREAGIGMVGGLVPARFYLVHFRSKQLASRLRHGRFWHAFPVGGGFVIDQDGKDTFTVHCPLAEGESSASLDPREVVYRVIGGYTGRWEVAIDTILVHSEWQPSFGIAEKYSTDSGRVLLAGDAAHRSPPHGGYGLNSGIVDAVDLSWRLAAVIKGYGGDVLLRAYDIERRPMMMRALRRSHRHLMEHVGLAELYARNWDELDSESEKGREVRAALADYIARSGPETLDRGIEMDLRYDHSPCIWPDGSPSVPWGVKRYTPSTRPGSRAPHVFLRDGVTSTYDLFGREWTLMQFIREDGDVAKANTLLEVAKRFNFPVKHAVIRNEEHARKIWERDLVLVRPDTHVAWRGNEAPGLPEAEQILAVVSGRMERPGYTEPSDSEEAIQFRKTMAALGVNEHNDQLAIMHEYDRPRESKLEVCTADEE